MALVLIDSLSLAGNPAKPNDDAWGHIEDAAVVMDGATGVGENLLPGESDAAWLARFGSRRILAHLRDENPPKEALRHALADAEKSFLGLRRRAPTERHEIPYASMMLVVLREADLEALWFGDCAALVKRPDEPIQIVGEAFERRSAESANVAALAAAKGLSPAGKGNRAEYLPALRASRNRMNTGKGGWCFGPDPSAADHVSAQTVSAPKDTLVLLASDGFLALASDYGAYDADGLVATAASGGLEGLATELRAIEADDPEGSKFPRFKTSDDATAVLLRVA
jgi:hypothetical protein